MKDDLDKYIEARKKRDTEFEVGFDEGYRNFKINVLLRQLREENGISQEEIAKRLHTKKSAISRIENHAEDIRLSTLNKYVEALNKKIRFEIV
ncbi:MAG: transcriptional regulator [Ignavibacteria bacterium GWB2_35_12]|nr:MAG: transcriptional regulator [Ignavibacteria bacterium GWA2_35_8]OGU38932.1 MAG: transcriptional regulator [Ignavibacteria bacterium GWB2_35_12]OGU88422.1 MAG: transcriptional regulator [Ignavibacteria bacterium RIFOXYA2_FULL_35_10]OGV20410.1 MAG: transcriptional regulator [Ignavibacteria bacterium RIFOXYC2_FULL_35_21]